MSETTTAAGYPEEREDRELLVKSAYVNAIEIKHALERTFAEIDRLREDMKQMDQGHAHLAGALHKENTRLRSQLEAAELFLGRAAVEAIQNCHDAIDELGQYANIQLLDGRPYVRVTGPMMDATRPAPEEDRHE